MATAFIKLLMHLDRILQFITRFEQTRCTRVYNIFGIRGFRTVFKIEFNYKILILKFEQCVAVIIHSNRSGHVRKTTNSTGFSRCLCLSNTVSDHRSPNEFHLGHCTRYANHNNRIYKNTFTDLNCKYRVIFWFYNAISYF